MLVCPMVNVVSGVSCCDCYTHCLLCLMQRLKTDVMEGFERQLQELIDDFVQEVEDTDQLPACNGPTKSFKLVTL